MDVMLKPWPWYITGPLIGLMVPLLLLFGNKMFGISSTLRHFCAACIPTQNKYFKYDWKAESWNLVFALGVVVGGFIAFQYLVDTRTDLFVSPRHSEDVAKSIQHTAEQEAMIMAKTFYPDLTMEARFMFKEWGLNSVYFHPHPIEVFSWQKVFSLPGLIFMVLGGFLVGFGTRYANGCTSGHSIMGLSQLSPASLVATIGFFIGGLISSWFMVPYLLKLL